MASVLANRNVARSDRFFHFLWADGCGRFAPFFSKQTLFKMTLLKCCHPTTGFRDVPCFSKANGRIALHFDKPTCGEPTSALISPVFWEGTGGGQIAPSFGKRSVVKMWRDPTVGFGDLPGFSMTGGRIRIAPHFDKSKCCAIRLLPSCFMYFGRKRSVPKICCDLTVGFADFTKKFIPKRKEPHESWKMALFSINSRKIAQEGHPQMEGNPGRVSP